MTKDFEVLRKSAAVAAAVGLLLAAGCTVGPKYRRPAAATPPAFKELPSPYDQWKTANPSDGTLRENWWEMFNDSQLSQLEEKVAVANQNVKQAEAQFRQARALVRLNRANYFPTITAQPSITTSYASPNLGSHRLGNTGVFTDYSLAFGASWEPDFWGRVSLSVQNAAANAQASAADAVNIRLSLQADVAADYFLLQGLDMEQKLLNDTIVAYERALKLTVDRYHGGVASKADIALAQTQLDQTRAQSTDIGVQRSQLEHAIAVLIGQPPSQLTLPTGQIHNAPPGIPAGVPSDLLQRRPDIAASERLVAAANAQIGLARAAYYPSLLLSATGGVESGSITTWLSWPSRFWSVGPTLAQTLFDFGRRRAQLQEFEAAYDSTVASYRATVLGAFQEVEDNLAALRILGQEAVQQEAAVKGSQESLQLEIERYKAGTVSYLDVITTQTIALTNQRSAVQILERRMTAAVQLIRALGGGWDASILPSPQALKSAEAARPAPAQP